MGAFAGYSPLGLFPVRSSSVTILGLLEGILCKNITAGRVVNFWNLLDQQLTGKTIDKNDLPVKVGKMKHSKIFVKNDLFF